MGRLMLLLSILGTSTLLAISFFDTDNSVLMFASSDTVFTYLRLAMLTILVALIATHPPRQGWLKMMIGSFSIALSAWALWQTFIWSMGIIDLLAILQFGVAAGINVLEGMRAPTHELHKDEPELNIENVRMTVMQPSAYCTRR